MLISKRITEYRPTLILVVLILLSLISLASGKRGNVLSDTVGTAVSVVAYPFWKVLTAVGDGVDYARGFVTQYGAAQTQVHTLQNRLDALLPELSEREELRSENRRLRSLLDFHATTRPALVFPPSAFTRAAATWWPTAAEGQ